MGNVKKVMAIHDLSGRGHCSLGAILPILTVMGVEVCPLPTAVLSTQTDGYEGYSFVDLATVWDEYLTHWQKEQMDFDCIYSGFLGSAKQIAKVGEVIEAFAKDDTLILIDPVLGDNGSLYDTMSEEMVVSMQELVKKAKVITPNYTELLLLLGEKYGLYGLDETIVLIKKLAQFGPETIIVTSVPVGEELCTIVYEKAKDVAEVIRNDYLKAHYPGSGDIFASVVCAMLLKNATAREAAQKGADFIREGIRISMEEGQAYREGIVLEKAIGYLLQ